MDNGAEIHTVQILLGHQSIQTTQVYTHMPEEGATRL